MNPQQAIQEAFHWRRVVGVSVVYGLPFLFSILRWQTRKRSSPVLQFRNPPIVYCMGFYSFASCVLETIQLLTPNGLCISEYFERASIFSLLIGPLLFRAAQYLLVMDEELRRRFPRCKSPKLAFKLSMCFGMCNLLVFNAFFWWIIRYPPSSYVSACKYVSYDTLYGMVMGSACFAIAILFTYQLRGQHDAYLVAKETRIWFYFGPAMGCCALPLGSLDSLFGIPGWRLGGISAIVYQLFTFSLLQLHPLWIDYVQSRHKKRLRVPVYSAPIVVVKQQKSLNSNEEGENSLPYHSASVRETGAHGPYFFLQQSKHQLQSEARDISDFVSDPVILTFIHDFAKARFVPEISRFLYAAYQYRQMADTVPDEEQPGSPAAEPTNKSLVWDLGLREAYLGMVAEFFAPDSPYEVNVEAGVLRRAAALAPAGVWRAASAARRAAVFEEARHEVAALFEQNFGPEFRAALVQFCRRLGAEEEEEKSGWEGSRGGAAPPALRGWRLRSALRSTEMRQLQGEEDVAARRRGCNFFSGGEELWRFRGIRGSRCPDLLLAWMRARKKVPSSTVAVDPST